MPRTVSDRIFGLIAAALVVAAVGVALAMIHAPGTMRELRFDTRRMEDLEHIAQGLDCYWTSNGGKALPDDLESLAQWVDGRSVPPRFPAVCRSLSTTDPETGAAYAYRHIDGGNFELCATFARASDDAAAAEDTYKRNLTRRWHHEAGRSCFQLTAKINETR